MNETLKDIMRGLILIPFLLIATGLLIFFVLYFVALLVGYGGVYIQLILWSAIIVMLAKFLGENIYE